MKIGVINASAIITPQVVASAYKYKYNTETESRSSITTRKNTTFTTHFHVHPYGDDTPSDTDFKSKIKRLKSGLTIPSVIYYSTGKNKSASQKY